MYLPIKFNGSVLSQLPVYDTLAIDWQLMGAKEIKAEIELPGVLLCPIGCSIEYGGQTYTVNTVPDVTKSGDNNYNYNITFESDQYRLYDKLLKHLHNKTFQYYGSPEDYAQLIVDNINGIDSGWTVGSCDDENEKTINFDGHTCRTALDTIAESFAFEWNINGKELSFVRQVGNLTTHIFKYGMGNGLYSLGYQYQSDKNIVTRAFGYGSTRNLPENYRDGATQLMFEGLSLDKNVFMPDGVTPLYRIKEGDYVNEDIFPKVEGSVTAFSAYDPNAGSFNITDTAITFNLKDNFSSQTPKISFLTGELQGQEFEILDYNNTTKTIKIKVFTDGSNNKLPNSAFQPAIGDTYTLFDMFLPPEKVTEAEGRLLVATQDWLDVNSIPRVVYNLDLDPLYARDNGIILSPGDKVTVIDEALGIDNLIRVTAVNYPLNFPDIITPNTKISIQIANFIPYSVSERVIAASIDNKHDIKIVDRTNSEKARVNSLNLRTLQGRIFNPDGTLFDGPESLVAGMAAFGYDSQNFNLNDVTILPNTGADPNAFIISAGTLIHRIYKVDGLGYTWTLPIHTWSGLNPAKFYYVYAKCNKASLAGTWEISETPISVNDITGYYAFNIGILYEVNTDGYRDFEFTKGMTYIVGDTITTGRIKDITGVNYFDLTSGEFNIGDSNTGLDWNVTTPATLTIRGALASKVIQVGSAGVVNAGISGVTDAGTSSIRFWAGADAAHKSTAPFRILDDGSVIASKGKIGNWNIDSVGLVNDSTNDVYMRTIKRTTGGSVESSVYVGTDGSSDNSALGVFITNKVGSQINQSAYFSATGSTTRNIAASYDGDVVIGTALYAGASVGITGTFEYERNGHAWEFTYRYGILIGQRLIS